MCDELLIPIDWEYIDLLKNILNTQNELLSMPELETLRRIDNFSHTLYIFNKNYSELKKLFDSHNDYSHAMELCHPKNKQKINDIQLEILRLLHNFVAAALSLIDHSRNYYNDLYRGNNRFPEYEQEVEKRFLNNPLACFVKDLRQFFQHYKIPSILSQVVFIRKTNITRIILQLEKSTLTQFSKWSSAAKEYLKDQGDLIDLFQLISNYYLLIIDFHRWIIDRQKEIHSNEFKKIAEKYNELLSLTIPHKIKCRLEIVNQGIGSPDDIFADILTQNEWVEVEKCSADSTQRCEKIINFINQKTPLPLDLKEEIKNLFSSLSIAKSDKS
ncbi:MAG: hypothetical protein NG784_05860 [Candidatus Jettenia sp.]|nr:hypothetical protein [Candidatus Jettenia sp.]